jgi:hypothetical protein
VVDIKNIKERLEFQERMRLAGIEKEGFDLGVPAILWTASHGPPVVDRQSWRNGRSYQDGSSTRCCRYPMGR